MSKYLNDGCLSIAIDPRSHLEAFDEKHRYGKNLRAYFKYYVANVHSTIVDDSNVHQSPNMADKFQLFSKFFKWLDDSDVEISDCTRAALNTEVVAYLTTDEARSNYVIDIDEDGVLWQRTPEILGDQAVGPKRSMLTTPDGMPFIFVIRGNTLFASEKITKKIPRFHHSSFFAGESVEAAGQIVVKNGKLMELYPHSGHYRPQDKHLLYMIEFFRCRGVLFDFKVDAQRFYKISRAIEGGTKKKKVDAAHLVDVQSLYDLLRFRNTVFSSGFLKGIRDCNGQANRHKAGIAFSSHLSDLLNDTSEIVVKESEPTRPSPWSLTKPLTPLLDLGDGRAGDTHAWLKAIIQDSPMPYTRPKQKTGNISTTSKARVLQTDVHEELA